MRLSQLDSDLSQVDRSTVAVVKSNSVEHLCRFSDVSSHVIPEKRTVAWTVAVAQLDVVAPRNQLSPQVDVGPYKHEMSS